MINKYQVGGYVLPTNVLEAISNGSAAGGLLEGFGKGMSKILPSWFQKIGTYLSPLNYAAAISKGSIDPHVGELEISTWHPNILLAARAGEMIFGSKAVKEAPKAATAVKKNVGAINNIRKSQKYMRDVEKEYNDASAILTKDAELESRRLTPDETNALNKLYSIYTEKLYGKDADITGLSYFSAAKGKSFRSKLERKSLGELDDGEVFATTGDVMKKATEDYNLVKPGHTVALVEDEALSKDSYPLLTSLAKRRVLRKEGEVTPVIDNGVYRMIKLNSFGKNKLGKFNIDRSIEALREMTGDKNIPDRFSIFGTTYVPAFIFRKGLGNVLGFDNAVTTFAPKAVAGPRWKVRPSVPNYIPFNDMYATVTKNLGRHLSKEEFAEIVKDLPMDFVSTGNGKGFTVFKMSPKEIDDFLIALARNITEKRPYHEPPEYLAKYAAQIINRPEIAVLKFPSTGIKKTTASPYAQRILDNTVFPRLQANRPWMKDVGKGFNYDDIYEIPDAYYLFAKKDAPASYSPKTDVIRVNDHKVIDANVPHELRHRADAAYPYTEFEQLVTSKAFEGFENAAYKPNYDMTVEIPTTILESRNFLLSKYLLDRWLDAPLEILNKIIAKAPGNAIFHAIQNSNGYGARFIKYLRETGLLTPERAEAFRKALIYGSLSSPLIMQGINQFGMIDSKKKGGKTHKPFGHRSILDNGWQSTKLLKNKKNVYGK